MTTVFRQIHPSQAALLVPIALVAAILTRTGTGLDALRAPIYTLFLFIALCSFGYYVIRSKSLPQSFQTLLWTVLVFGFVYVIAAARSDFSVNAMKPPFQLILIFGWLFFLSFARINDRTIQNIFIILIALVVANIALWMIGGFPLLFTGTFGHKNTLGAIMSFALYLTLIAKINLGRRLPNYATSPLLLAILFLLYASNSRATQLAVLISLAFYFFWPLVTRNKFVFHGFLVLVFCLSAGIVVFVVSLAALPDDHAINGLVSNFTGRRIASGRDLIWPLLILAIAQKPFFGHGTGIEISDLLHTEGVMVDWSAHNLFLAISFETGLIGLAIFVFVVFQIWTMFYTLRKDPYVRLAGCFLISCLIESSFGVSLTQNNLAIGVLQWMIVGIGLNRVRNHMEVKASKQRSINGKA